MLCVLTALGVLSVAGVFPSMWGWLTRSANTSDAVLTTEPGQRIVLGGLGLSVVGFLAMIVAFIVIKSHRK